LIALSQLQLTTIDAQYQQRDVLIAFRNLYGDHTGAAQASVILRVLEGFEIAPRLHCFVGDNASNNDAELIRGLNDHESIHLTGNNRIRCAGHIINLVVKATLYGKGVSRFEAALAAASPGEQYELFRSHRVVGKLHNFVNAVCASHKRRELFLSLQKDPRDDDDDALYTYSTLQLRQDRGVRWHSVYYMLLRCLELRNSITRFTTRLQQQASQRVDDEYNPLTDELSSEEWEGVQQLVDFLQAAVEMTKRLEGNNSASGYGSLWQTLPSLQALWRLYDDTRRSFNSDDNNNSEYFVAAIKHGFEKLNSYFEKLIIEPETSYYVVATALHPALRLAWFQTHWKQYNDWVKRAKDSTSRVFKLYMAEEMDDDDTALPLPRRKVPGSDNSDLYSQTMAVDLMYLTGSKSHKRQKRTTQLEEYFDDLRDDLTNATEQQLVLLHNPWRWWLEIGRKKYPVVFKIATDYLSIPATSCECERCFSTAKRTITSDRNSLNAATIEALQLQKNWLRHGVVDSEVLKLQLYVQRWDNKQGNNNNKASNSDVTGDSSEMANNSDNTSYLGGSIR